MNIEYIPVSELRPAAYNPRTMSDDMRRMLKANLQEFGLVDPLIVNKDGTVIGGHQRLQAAMDLGMKEVPCHRLDVDKTREKALNLALNKLSGEFDLMKLPGLLLELQGDEFDLDLTGFGDLDLQGFDLDPDALSGDGGFGSAGERTAPEILDGAPEPQIDHAEELQKKWKVQPGQLYQIGTHRLLCGSATIPADVDRLMGGSLADFVFTDPPYGIAYSGRGESTSQQTIENDALDPVALQAFLLDAFKLFPVKPGTNLFVCHTDQKPGIRPAFEQAFLAAGFELGGTIIWVKNVAGMGWQDFRGRHEPMLFGWTAGGERMRVEDRTQTTVWEVDREGGYLHPTTKPVKLPAQAMELCSKPGAVTYEPFAGSGSTMLAAELTGRSCCAIELEPKYCAVILERMQETGLQPQLVK